jgi:hypothetical protein
MLKPTGKLKRPTRALSSWLRGKLTRTLGVGMSQDGHKNRETENRTEAETELTEISVFSINRYFFGFHLY